MGWYAIAKRASAAAGMIALAQSREDARVPTAGSGTDADRELVARSLAGERAAFEALLRRHYDRMHRIAWRMTGSQTDADDITQDVCCALIEKLTSFRGDAKFTTWLFGVVVNACRDHMRGGQRLKRLRAGFAVLTSLAAAPDGRDLYQRNWMASELSRLDPAFRETIVLVIGEDMTHAEAAAALGTAETTVSWRMHKAKRRLSSRTLKEVTDDL
jgi:RNA polymerase sigma factor (sigma-70 family)